MVFLSILPLSYYNVIVERPRGNQNVEGALGQSKFGGA
jgi:hypothetical protein